MLTTDIHYSQIRLSNCMKKYLLSIAAILLAATTIAQSTITRQKIALFVPLYLDSAFDATTLEYRYGKQFPKYISPGLEFYEGAQLALDSLEKEGVPLEVTVYDTRSGKTLSQLANEKSFAGTNLIIAHVANYNEVNTLASIAEEKKIPFINANLPNDGGVTQNPYLIVLNSTLRTHCQGIYRYLQKNFATARIVAFQKNGNQETILKSYFTEFAKSTMTALPKIRFVTLESDFTPQQLSTYLDSNETTICIGASLDEVFAKNLSQQLATVNKLYPSQLIGMPTWDVIPFDKKEYMGLEICYSTPFYMDKTNKVSVGITNHFKTALYQRPSDLVFRGYECFYHFGKLLAEQGVNLASGIGEKKYKVFDELDIQPVFLGKPTQEIDYFENKKLYFVKKVNGEIKGIY